MAGIPEEERRIWINVHKLADYLYEVSGLHVGVHSVHGADTEYAASGGDNRGNLCEYCREHCPSFHQKCLESDEEHLFNVARTKKTEIYRCRLGMTEAIVPVCDGDLLDGVVFLGQGYVVPDESMSFEAVYERLAEEYPDQINEVTREALREAYNRTAFLSMRELESVIGLAGFAARGIHIDQWLSRFRESVDKVIKRHVEALGPERLPLAGFSVQAIARRLNLSYSQLNRVSTKLYGKPLKQYVLDRKIDAAGRLLTEHSELSVSEVAARVGIDNPNYFVKLFQKKKGCRCVEYRNRSLTCSPRPAQNENEPPEPDEPGEE